MAGNSKREQLIIADKELVEATSRFKTVQRIRPVYADLENFAQTQFPVAAIVGSLPVPIPKPEGRGVQKEQFIMDLDVQIFCFLHQNQDVDTLISDIVDSLWAKLNTDHTRSGLAIETTIKPEKPVHGYAPYAGFQITINHKYITNTGGI